MPFSGPCCLARCDLKYIYIYLFGVCMGFLCKPHFSCLPRDSMEKMQNMQWTLQLCCMNSLIYNLKSIRDLIFRVAHQELYTVKSHKKSKRNLNKHKPNKRTKSTQISSLFPKRGNRNTKSTEKHKNKSTHGKTYNKSSRRTNHKATRSKTNTETTALERSVEQTTGV